MPGGTARPSATRHPSSSPIRSFFTYRLFVSATFSLLFLASVTLFLSHNRSIHSNPIDPHNSDPLRLRLHLLRRHSHDHLSLLHAYSSFSLKLKISSSKSLDSFTHLSQSLSDLASKMSSNTAPLDDDSLKALEKEAKDKIKLARQIISESKESFDTQLKIQKLRDTIFAVNEQLSKAKKMGALSSTIAAVSTPKSIHCLNMRLMGEKINFPNKYRNSNHDLNGLSSNQDLYHYALFSDNVIAVSVVVNSVIKNAKEPGKLVFHVVSDKMYVEAMRVWFVRRPLANGAKIVVKSVSEFNFLNLDSVIKKDAGRVLEFLRFYLPEMFSGLKKIVLLEDDVVVQKDLSRLWTVDLDGKVNGAVEMCFGVFQRYNKYLNFSSLEVKEKFSPRACAWGFGVNVFDLDAWRREKCTEDFHRYYNLNEDGALWNPSAILPAGLVTFYTTTKPIDKSWNVMGLGYNPSVSQEEIRNAAVIHFNGNMKPWLDVAMNQYKHLWTKYVDAEMDLLQLCNFGL